MLVYKIKNRNSVAISNKRKTVEVALAKSTV